jgi:hypothetical protein
MRKRTSASFLVSFVVYAINGYAGGTDEWVVHLARTGEPERSGGDAQGIAAEIPRINAPDRCPRLRDCGSEAAMTTMT